VQLVRNEIINVRKISLAFHRFFIIFEMGTQLLMLSPRTDKITLRTELQTLWQNIKTMEFKPAFILISAAVIQVISYYYTSRRFFRWNLSSYIADDILSNFYEHIYWLTSEFLSQFVLPMLLILFVLKEKPRDYGMRFGDARIGLKIVGVFLAVMIPILWFVSSLESFSSAYPQCLLVRTDWRLFIIYELCFILYMTGWEFIWRGYVLFGLKEKFGYYAILIQMIPFTILHNGKPELETFSAIIAGIALGILAWRTNSFWYCVLTHSSVMFCIDLMATLRYRTKVYGVGIGSLVEIIQKTF
jgi:membrane protease YdiL (CAAX protease family)